MGCQAEKSLQCGAANKSFGNAAIGFVDVEWTDEEWAQYATMSMRS
jgi:hypothetical protein